MKKKRKNRLPLLLVMMGFTITMLGTTTYAWFTANRTVTVNDIQVNIAASGGIQVSEDGQNWRSLVTDTQLVAATTLYPAAVNQIPGELNAVSTGLIVDSTGKMEMYTGSVTADGTDFELSTTKSTETHGTAGSFVAFDLFIRLDSSVGGTIYLTPNSGVIADGTDTGIKNASRIAFVNLGNTPIGNPLSTVQALNAGAAANVRMWEPNHDSHTSAAVTHAFNTYGLTVANNDTFVVPYDGVVAEFGTDDNILVGEANAVDNPTLFADVTPTFSTVAGFSTYPTAFTLTPGTITKMRIYMWIEGQDVDCENAASGANIIYNLQFSLDNV